jgi:hypothetical protein
MLDPHQSHRVGDTFLKWFLKDVFSDQKVTWINEFRVDSLNTDSVVIHREFKSIDLLLETPNFVVIIENKLWSKEHSNQLSRYKTVVEREFPDREHAFVFLTPYAEAPEQDEDREAYVLFNYESIIRILEIIMQTYGHSISDKVSLYIQDYISVVRRYVMQDDEAIAIAREIYNNHKEALDFIFENKPDRLLEVKQTVEDAVLKSGYVLGSLGKGYARFLTPKLDAVIPKGQDGGWRNGEGFLFEVIYRNKVMTLNCVVSPGPQSSRERMINALKTIDGAKNPKGLKWSSVHTHAHRVNVDDERYDDLGLLAKDIEEMLGKEKAFINEVESVLLEALHDKG